MKINVLTIFPDSFKSFEFGVISRAIESEKITVNVVDIRKFSKNKHKKVDDTPFGGGSGMVMMAQPIHDAILSLDPEHKIKRIYMSPKGEKFSQKIVEDLSKLDEIIILCGHYEGVDQRVIDLHIDQEISIGDYILTGGELAAMVVMNAVSRYVEGVLGSSCSLEEESFSGNLLEYPQYTKPQVFEDLKVPDVLLSGNHKEIEAWRKEQSLKITLEKRPDLLEDK